MSNLRCHDRTCCHNHSACCGKIAISVSQDAHCQSYDGKLPSEGYDQELAEDIARSNCMSSQRIDCEDRDCQNNENSCCSLKNLRIDRVNSEPICVNYRKRM